MQCGRPGGFSDSEDSDDDFFFDEPVRRMPYYAANEELESRKKIEADLQAAIADDNLPLVLDIIHNKLGGDVNSRLSSGWTALLHAALHARLPILTELLHMGADVNLHGGSTTALMAACSNETRDDASVEAAAQTLVRAGALVNVGDMYGCTPLMKAAAAGRKGLVGALLALPGTNTEMRDLQGWTAVFWAVHHDRDEIVELLTQHGARLAEVDRTGRTPLDIAAAHDHQHLVRQLRDSGQYAPERDAETAPDNTPADWTQYYPVRTMPDYTHEVRSLLYGIKCERLAAVLDEHRTDLRSFLQLDDIGMKVAGVELPFERRRLRVGLYRFHTRPWKIDAVGGLLAQRSSSYSTVDCLSALGAHLLQVYVLESTLQYASRRAPVPLCLAPVLQHITFIRNHLKLMHSALAKISESQCPPADLVHEAEWPGKAASRPVSIALPVLVLATCGATLYYCRQ